VQHKAGGQQTGNAIQDDQVVVSKPPHCTTQRTAEGESLNQSQRRRAVAVIALLFRKETFARWLRSRSCNHSQEFARSLFH